MNCNRGIVIAMPENFTSLVVGNSYKGPILGCYGSRHADSCMALLPTLVEVADEFVAMVLLVLLDPQEHSRFARERGTLSIPMVVVYLHGRETEIVRGAYSGTVFRGVIEKHQRPAPRSGGCHRRLDQAKLLASQRDHAAAAALLGEIPDTALRDPEVRLPSRHLALIRTARPAPARAVWVSMVEDRPDDDALRCPLNAKLPPKDEDELAPENLDRRVMTAADPVRGGAQYATLATMAQLGSRHPPSRKYEAAQGH